MFVAQYWQTGNQENDKNSLNKLLELRARTLQEQCFKVKEYRKLLEQKKAFWRNREEQFRIQCFKVKKAVENQQNSKNGTKGPLQQQRVNQSTAKILQKAEKFLKSQSTNISIRQRKV